MKFIFNYISRRRKRRILAVVVGRRISIVVEEEEEEIVVRVRERGLFLFSLLVIIDIYYLERRREFSKYKYCIIYVEEEIELVRSLVGPSIRLSDFFFYNLEYRPIIRERKSAVAIVVIVVVSRLSCLDLKYTVVLLFHSLKKSPLIFFSSYSFFFVVVVASPSLPSLHPYYSAYYSFPFSSSSSNILVVLLSLKLHL